MNNNSKNKIVADWIVNQETFWAWEAMDKASREDPELALELIEMILEKIESSETISSLGAGPLEDLLSNFGPEVIDRVELKARNNEKFYECLANTWKNAMTDDIWARVCKVSGRSTDTML